MFYTTPSSFIYFARPSSFRLSCAHNHVPFSFVDASQTLAGILRHPFSALSLAPSIVPKLRASFCWAFDGEIPRFAMLVWSFFFVLYFSLLLRAPDSDVLVPISHDRKIPTSYSAHSVEKISSRNDFDNNAKMETCGDDLISMFPKIFFLILFGNWFHPFPYRYTYQFDKFELWLSVFDTYYKRD